HLRRAVEGDPTSVLFRYELGQTLRLSGDVPGAIASLEKAIELDPEKREGYYALGVALRQQSASARRALPPAGGAPGAKSPAGVALWYSGSRDKALAELRKSVLLDPAAGDGHAFLGAALRETGDLAGARASLQRAIALLPPTAAVYVDLGITYLRSGDLDRALG